MSIDRDQRPNLLKTTPETKWSNWRRLVSLGTIALGLTGAALDSQYTNKSQEEQGYTSITHISDPEFEHDLDHAAWIVLPGFKMSWEDSRKIGEKLSPTLSERGHVYSLGYSNKGLDIEEVYSEVTELADSNDIDTLHFYGHSAGNLVAVDLAGLIDQRRDDIRVETIVSDSGPTGGGESVYDKKLLQGMAATKDMNIPVPTTTVRFVAEASERVVNRDERSFKQIAEQTFNELRPTAASTQLMLSVSDYIVDFDREKFSQLPDETQVFLISNIEDAMIDQRYVREDLSSLLGDKLKMIYAIDDTWPAHASPQYNDKQYGEIIENMQISYMPLWYADHGKSQPDYRER